MTKAYFGLDTHRASRWWVAVQRARTDRAKAFRAAMRQCDGLHHPLTLARVERFVAEDATPQVLLALVEDLVQDGDLTRHEALAIENALLAQVDAQGRWYETRRRG
jgi:hypothetical protein